MQQFESICCYATAQTAISLIWANNFVNRYSNLRSLHPPKIQLKRIPIGSATYYDQMNACNYFAIHQCICSMRGFYYERCNPKISMARISINSISNRICADIVTCMTVWVCVVVIVGYAKNPKCKQLFGVRRTLSALPLAPRPDTDLTMFPWQSQRTDFFMLFFAIFSLLFPFIFVYFFFALFYFLFFFASANFPGYTLKGI